MAGTPASQLVDLMAAGVHRNNESVPPSSGAPPLVCRDGGLPLLWSRPQKRVHHPHTATTSVVSKEDKATLQEVPLPSGPSKAIAGYSGSSKLKTALQRGSLIPCRVPQLELPLAKCTFVRSMT